jgi:pre-mRNA-splicing factor SYF2
LSFELQAEWSDKQKRNKLDPDQGFSSYEDASFRKYNQLVKSIKPDMEAYEDAKARTGEAAFYANEGAIVHGTHK